MERRLIWTDTIVGSSASALGTVLGLLATAIAARTLGPTAYGTVGAAVAWITFFSTLFHLSLSQVVIHNAGKTRPEDVARDFPNVAAVALVSGTTGALLLVLTWYAFSSAVFGALPLLILVALIPQLAAQVWIAVSQGFFQAAGTVRLHYYLNFSTSLTNLLGMLFFVEILHFGLWGVVASSVTSSVLAALTNFVLTARRFGSSIAPQASRIQKILRKAMAIHLSAVGYLLFAYTDILIVNRFAGADQVAWYRIASFFFGVFVFFPQAMSSAFFAQGAKLGPTQSWAHQRKLILEALALASVIAAMSYPLWPALVRIVAGPGFEPSANLVRILLLGVWGMMLSALMAPQWILRGYLWSASLTTIGNGALNVALNFWLVPRWGAFGAAWAKSACFAVTTIINVWAAIYLFSRPDTRRSVGTDEASNSG